MGEMQESYIKKAQHNEKFHSDLCDCFEDKYYDWKITSLFYTAIHWIKVLAEKDNKQIGVTHKEINNNIDPKNERAEMKISKGAYHYYINLYKESKTARYDGINIDHDSFEKLKEGDWKQCQTYIEGLKAYMINKRGLTI